VIKICKILAPFRLPQPVADCFATLAEPLLNRIRGKALRLEETKKTLKAMLALLRQVLSLSSRKRF